MSYTHSKVIKELLSPDGAHRLDIVARHDGVFQVYEQLTRPASEGGWLPGKVWGLFDTIEEAEAAAKKHFARQK